MDKDSQYLQMFFDEASEYIQILNENILILENEPENKEVINSVFRAAHSLKGMAATMGFDSLTELTHKIENLLDQVRNEEIKVTVEVVDCLFAGFDLIKSLVNDIKEQGEENTDINEYLTTINQVKEEAKKLEEQKEEKEEKEKEVTKEDKGNGLAIEEKSEFDVDFALEEDEFAEIKDRLKETDIIYKLKVELEEDSILKSVRGYMVLNKADELGYVIKSIPQKDEIEDKEDFSGTVYLIMISQMEMSEIEDELLNITDVDDIEIIQKEVTVSDSSAEKKDVDTVQKKDKETDSQNKFSSSKQKKSDTTSKSSKKSSGKKDFNVAPTVRVDINKLDTLMNMVGELLINKTRLEGLDVDLEIYQDIIQQLDRVTMELHHVVMQIRMVPIGGIFNRFPRMVRDLARDMDKQIDLKIEGAETELDRSIIDELADPLVHLLRNAVDHGIETPQERKEADKDPTGEILLEAYQKGSEIIIRIEDDGAGIDEDKIASLAVEKGLISQEEVSSLSKKEKLNFVFDPGFSTSREVTDVSGRGVGMDVVKSVVKKLDGQVTVNSEVGKGTEFTISLPLTLAITQALMIDINNEVFAIPLNAVSETLTIQSEDLKQVRGQEVIVIRDSTIPVVSASNRLNLGSDVESYKAQDDIPIVIVNSGDRQIGIIVDDLLNQQEIVIKPLGKYLADTEHISGATIVGDGDVALILDVRNIA
ncbi:MAG: chemotaxis protein CheW [Halanaerobiaceae bacterium]